MFVVADGDIVDRRRLIQRGPSCASYDSMHTLTQSWLVEPRTSGMGWKSVSGVDTLVINHFLGGELASSTVLRQHIIIRFGVVVVVCCAPSRVCVVFGNTMTSCHLKLWLELQ